MSARERVVELERDVEELKREKLTVQQAYEAAVTTCIQLRKWVERLQAIAAAAEQMNIALSDSDCHPGCGIREYVCPSCHAQSAYRKAKEGCACPAILE